MRIKDKINHTEPTIPANSGDLSQLYDNPKNLSIDSGKGILIPSLKP